MTSVVARWCIVSLTFLLLAGCSLPALNMPGTQETELFAQGLDQLLASGDLTTLNQLLQQYPQGEWQTKAAGLITMVKKQKQLQEQQQALLEKQEQKLASLKDNKALAVCQQQKDALAQDNQVLEKTLKRLKEVLIDTELQAK
ncbi:hypothetical protein [Geopsychrobacter electrodiphilus]|uniref:hypothetical protein n=1 Tax=Geopsychrobacter electrodiphilus TaxID=225196 RepID=UPI00036E9A9B|nr:hypothetical protein [Geopsychrobacter electrodiphilus]